MDKSQSWALFDDIAPRYDLLNRLLSFGCDRAWRNAIASRVQAQGQVRLLDLGTGTGDLLLTLWARCKASLASVTGLDLSENMLALAKRKTPPGCPATWIHASAQKIPLPDQSQDSVTMAFAIRNCPDPPQVLREMVRVLAPGGHAYILEFSMPQSWLFRRVYLFYFRHILPLVGGWISGHSTAYRYLNQSVEAFPYGEVFAQWMRDAGFSAVTTTPFTFGVVTLYEGERP